MTDAPKSPAGNSSDSAPRSSSGVSIYVFSFQWLLLGLVLLLIAGAVVGGLYYYRTINRADHIVSAARQAFKEANDLLRTVDGKSDDEVQTIRREAYKIKEQAANILLDYRRQQPNDASPVVLTVLLEILESIQTDVGSTPTRRHQILEVCKQLRNLVQDKDSLEYRQRILELEWENGNLPEVLNGARDVLIRTGSNDYAAWRYFTMATLFQLDRAGYQQRQGDGGLTLPPSVNELLDNVHRMNPADIEISAIYADFIKDSARQDYRRASSPTFLALSDAERDRKAQSVIDDMVNRNSDNARAYLARYRFKARHGLLGTETEKLDTDLEKVLQLTPNDADSLVLAGMHTLQQMGRARAEGNTQLAEGRRAAAMRYFQRTIESNPENSVGYGHLGDLYMSEGNSTEAVRIWRSCLERNPLTNQEIIGRLAIALIDLRQLDAAAETIGLLDNVIKEYRVGNPRLATQVQNLVRLLSAKLYDAQGAEAVAKADAAAVAGQGDEARKFYAVAQKKYADASQILHQALRTFGNSPYDYIVDPVSIHSRIISDSLMLAGRLAMERAEWDVAASYYQKAARFPRFRDQAVVAAANAYIQMNLHGEATELLAEAVRSNPDSIPLRNLYAQNLFRREMAIGDPGVRNLDLVEQQFKLLAEHKDQIPRPWTVDFRLIHLEMIRESSSLDSERSIRAVQTAIRKYKALESAEFPTPVSEDGTEEAPKKYSDDLNFLSDLAGVYSSLVALADFDRVLIEIRDFPEGEPIYFERRIADALQRNDREGAAAIIAEAQDSPRLTPTQKQGFVAVSQRLKGDQPEALDSLYEQLKRTHEQNPDALKPQVFFLMANMALDREDTEYAKAHETRLESIEGEGGTMWRFIRARRLMAEQDPPMDVVKQLLQEILDRRPDWDMTYTLKAMIEEKELLVTPDDKDLKRRLVDSYRQSIRCGNVQPMVWNRLLNLLEDLEMFDEVRQLQQEAIARSVRLQTAPGQFPRPYQEFYTRAHAAILNQDRQMADLAGRECLALAHARRESPELIHALNLAFGKLFLDNDIIEGAERHLTEIAKRGGSYVYPLAVCFAKDNRVDKGFALILDEIDRTPSSLQTLLPSLLVLLAQVRPSEAIFERIDRIVTRIEKGERPVLRGEVTTPDTEVDFGGVKRIHNMTIRFPDSDATPDPATLTILPPETE